MSNCSAVSNVSNVSIGFGAYKTRNFSKFEEATQKQIVTRRTYKNVIEKRPEVGFICDQVIKKTTYDN